MAVVVEVELGQLTGAYVAIGSQCHRDLLVVPLHHIEGELDQLIGVEVFVERGEVVVAQLGRLGHEGICEGHCCLVRWFQALRLAEHLLCELLVESLLLGNCRAKGQSRVAVMVVGTAKPNELSGHRVDRVLANRRGLPLHHGGHEFGVRSGLGWYAY